ncbi:TniQ family protein [Actinacidiphila glaucinigra]|uniref:TniQ family protein n=1 Tax=Actinacidiphila glaucinigra TaxID=235986 RepID=UPI002DDC846A|nr:TniQ family protein [Actinacidiphila glaucinigra]WSD57507.1 TniQ family protein [Actinacidiphila glaucinigra]WSD65138.1 TniQ family protein [Actinacidiphila glaucinigra]
MLDIPVAYGPRQPLPLRTPYVVGESTGSFVNRYAHSNGMELHEFLDRVGQGKASEDPARVGKYPQVTEMYVNAAGLRYLAVLTDQPAAFLQRMLPSLAEQHLLPGTDEAVWKWPWEPSEGHLVPCCTLCAQDRGVREPAWLMSADSWRVCPRHHSWTDDSRSDDPAFVDLAELPETVWAHRQRQRLRRWFGPAGEELFADAFQVAVHWWTTMPHATRWVQRARSAGLEVRAMRAAPLVLYPEAASLALAMLRFEHDGKRDPAGRARWLAGVQHLMEGWEVDFGVGKQPLLAWLERHSHAAAPAPAHSPRRCRLRLAMGHDRIAARTGSLDRRSCLPWQLGMAAAEL